VSIGISTPRAVAARLGSGDALERDPCALATATTRSPPSRLRRYVEISP